MEIDEGQVKKSVEEYGKIVVSIARVDFDRMPDRYEAPDVQISSKAVVKDDHVSHAIR
jgi:hypothetical protein